MAAKASAAVIWLHGLGDSGSGWSDLGASFKSVLPYVQWNFPDSPSIPVSCNGGFRMPAWFDLEEIPVTASTPDDVEGFKRSIDYVHGLVDKLADAGVPPERVVLGGFSQGAATVLLAGLSYPRKLAGIVAFSGWLAMRDTFPGHVHEAQKSTPVLQVHGRADDKVDFSLAVKSKEVLEASGLSVKWIEYAGLGHGMHPRQPSQLLEFLQEVLPPAASGSTAGGAGTAAAESKDEGSL